MKISDFAELILIGWWWEGRADTVNKIRVNEVRKKNINILCKKMFKGNILWGKIREERG